MAEPQTVGERIRKAREARYIRSARELARLVTDRDELLSIFDELGDLYRESLMLTARGLRKMARGEVDWNALAERMGPKNGPAAG